MGMHADLIITPVALRLQRYTLANELASEIYWSATLAELASKQADEATAAVRWDRGWMDADLIWTLVF